MRFDVYVLIGKGPLPKRQGNRAVVPGSKQRRGQPMPAGRVNPF